MQGKYRFKTSKNGILIAESAWVRNLIVDGTNTGLNLIRKALKPGSVSGIAITSAEIGTGTTSPTASDTDLETPVTTGILPATQEISGLDLVINFFIPDSDLADGTYNEFALRIGSSLFARSIISPAHTKATNEDTTVEYVITLDVV